LPQPPQPTSETSNEPDHTTESHANPNLGHPPLSVKQSKLLSTWLGTVRDLNSLLIKKSKVKLTVEDMSSFQEYYELVTSDIARRDEKKMDKAKQIADSRKKI